MILVRADRSAGRTPPASSLAANPGRNQERPADRGVTAGSAAVMARCTAACPLVNRRHVSESGPGVASAVRVARAPSSDVPRTVPPARPAGPDHPDAPDDVLPDAHREPVQQLARQG